MRVPMMFLVAAGALAGCAAPAPGPAAPVQHLARAQPMADPAPPPPPPSDRISADGASMGLADYMYGPPPRTRVDRRVRCRFDCPHYPPGSLLLLR